MDEDGKSSALAALGRLEVRIRFKQKFKSELRNKPNSLPMLWIAAANSECKKNFIKKIETKISVLWHFDRK
jgi:hypothetical protein